MTGRSDHREWVDVKQRGTVVGYVVPPSRPGGPWEAYLDFQQKAGSSKIALCSHKEAAMDAVRRAAFG